MICLGNASSWARSPTIFRSIACRSMSRGIAGCMKGYGSTGAWNGDLVPQFETRVTKLNLDMWLSEPKSLSGEGRHGIEVQSEVLIITNSRALTSRYIR